MKNIIKDKGITLVALVINIIVLLILVGVVLSPIFSNNGLIKKAYDIATKYKNASEDEGNKLNLITDKYNDLVLNNSREEASGDDYEGLEDAARIFFNNHVFTLKQRTTVVSTGTTTATDLHKMVSTITIPTEIIDSGLVSTGNVYVYISASKKSMSLSPSTDGFMYIIYNDTKYILYENNTFTSIKLQILEGVDKFEIYMGWKDYHTNAYINLNLSEKYTCYEGNMTEKSYGTGTITQTNLDKTVATESVMAGAKYFTASVTNSNIYVEPVNDVFMYILYNEEKYYFCENGKFKTASIPLVDGINSYEVHMGWNNYHTNAYENITLSVIYRNNTDVNSLNSYIKSLNEFLGYS